MWLEKVAQYSNNIGSIGHGCSKPRVQAEGLRLLVETNGLAAEGRGLVVEIIKIRR